MSMQEAKRMLTTVNVTKVSGTSGGVTDATICQDTLIKEQPLQIILHWFNEDEWQQRELSITMRTPNDDIALTFGFLWSQGIVSAAHDIQSVSSSEENTIEVTLQQSVVVDWEKLSRTFISHSGCGICGQSQLKSLLLSFDPFALPTQPWLSYEQVLTLPQLLRNNQRAFDHSGGCHGAGVWQPNGDLIVKEDVGRHNAVDKVLGRLFVDRLESQIQDRVLVLSGRISFELVQKAIAGNIATIVAIGAPSELAVTTAQRFNMTLIGFVKKQSFNIYSGAQRFLNVQKTQIKNK